LKPESPFRSAGITYEVAAKPKSDMYRDLLPLINSGKVELLDHSRLLAQLCNLERRTARSGKDSIDHAPGGHDDIANAAAGALVAAAGSMSKAEMWRFVGINAPRLLAQIDADYQRRRRREAMCRRYSTCPKLRVWRLSHETHSSRSLQPI
jgi:hypothetical protein